MPTTGRGLSSFAVVGLVALLEPNRPYSIEFCYLLCSNNIPLTLLAWKLFIGLEVYLAWQFRCLASNLGLEVIVALE